VAERPDERISAISLIAPADREAQAAAGRGSQTEFPKGCLHEIFAKRVEQDPDQPAIIAEGRTISYGELHRGSSRLAHSLREFGVRSGDLVALIMERSAKAILGMLAVLKAGGAYLPVDPAWPMSRQTALLRDAGVGIALVAGRGDPVPEGVRIVELTDHVIAGDVVTGYDSSGRDEFVIEAQLPGSPACVNYTSGSSGSPKGVVLAHEGLVRLVCETNYIAFSPCERVAHASNPAFDAALFEIWGALLHGATLVILNRDQVLVPEECASVLADARVSVILLTTALFNQMADRQPAAFASLNTVVFGGEAADARLVRRVLEHPPRNLVNAYGPTECSVIATCYAVRELPAEAVSVPIGRPIANTQAYIVDTRFQLVPPGVPGEIVLGGSGLALGYLGQAELTAEKFVPNPFSSEPGARLYRTGDRGRVREDGEIEFLGRLDRQVKIRGCRIEPGEIEMHLMRHPKLRQAAVVVHEEVVREDEAEKRLIAYVSPGVNPQPEFAARQVSQWEEIFDKNVYGDLANSADALFNTTGWNSTYDGKPIPIEEMRAWAGDIVGQVLDLRPRRVLEIGCGTGMLLFRIAPHCEAYTGVDISQVSLDYVRAQIDRNRPNYSNVTLAHRAANDLSSLPDGAFDVVLLSSVVQYFPSLEYLLDVIATASRKVRTGGYILLADLRSLPLLGAFHTSVQLHRAEASCSADELRSRVRQQMAQEHELFVHPDLFRALPQRIDRITGSQVRLARGRGRNELTRFRYAALLHLDNSPQGGDFPEAHAANAREVRAMLESTRPERIRFCNIPSTRVVADVLAYQRLSATDDHPVSEADAMDPDAIDPEEIRELAEALSYRVEITWSSSGVPGSFDAVLDRVGTAIPRVQPKLATAPDLRPYANEPLRARHDGELISELREYLKDRLPDYMVPASFVVLDELPLNSRGKLDLTALANQAPRRTSVKAEYAAPRSPLEAQIAQVWKNGLQLEKPGIDDNFFDLGGHSLLLVQIHAELREKLKPALRIVDLFRFPTIRGLAEFLAGTGNAAENEDKRLARIQDRSAKQVAALQSIRQRATAGGTRA
jgi:amino acid adenylation domain-containing protein